MAYWDTSCLVKLYVTESVSALFRMHVVGGAEIVISEIARMELWATLRRKEAEGDLAVGGALEALHVSSGLIAVGAFDSAVAEEFEKVIEECYALDPPPPLRTLDGIHLGSARVLKEAEVITTDQRMRDAASSLGFDLFPQP